jgi:predicted amidohydrolase
LARQYSALIVAGSWFEAAGDTFRNRTWLFSGSGKSVCTDKVMLTPEERRYGLERGDASAVVDTPFGRLGIAICYDVEFPVLVRKLVDAGADVILVPSCTDTVAGYHRVRIGCQARALENQCYVVQAVTVGAAPWSVLLDDNHGAAGVFSPPDIGFPSNGVIASGTLDEPQWVYGDIDVEFLRTNRQRGQVRGREDWARDEHLLPVSVTHDLC